jgi:hypothetical protein
MLFRVNGDRCEFMGRYLNAYVTFLTNHMRTLFTPQPNEIHSILCGSKIYQNNNWQTMLKG